MTLLDILNEAAMSLDDVKLKYYKDIPDDVWNTVNATLSTGNKISNKAKWVFDLSQKYYKKFNKFPNLSTAKTWANLAKNYPYTDIHTRTLKSVYELSKQKMNDNTSKEDTKDVPFKEVDNFKIYFPRTYEDMRKLGRKTSWCVSADSEQGRTYYNSYVKTGKLMMLLDTKTGKRRLFHKSNKDGEISYANEDDLMLDTEYEELPQNIKNFLLKSGFRDLKNRQKEERIEKALEQRKLMELAANRRKNLNNIKHFIPEVINFAVKTWNNIPKEETGNKQTWHEFHFGNTRYTGIFIISNYNGSFLTCNLNKNGNKPFLSSLMTIDTEGDENVISIANYKRDEEGSGNSSRKLVFRTKEKLKDDWTFEKMDELFKAK